MCDKFSVFFATWALSELRFLMSKTLRNFWLFAEKNCRVFIKFPPQKPQKIPSSSRLFFFRSSINFFFENIKRSPWKVVSSRCILRWSCVIFLIFKLSTTRQFNHFFSRCLAIIRNLLFSILFSFFVFNWSIAIIFCKQIPKGSVSIDEVFHINFNYLFRTNIAFPHCSSKPSCFSYRFLSHKTIKLQHN